MTTDVSQVISLAASFAEMGQALPREVRDSVKKAAQNVKDDARKGVSTHIRWKHLAGSINYDIEGGGSSSSAVIGYDKGGQGNFGHFAEYGTANYAPHPALFPAFESEAERFPEWMSKIAADVSKKAL